MPLFRTCERRQDIRPAPGAEIEHGFDERDDRRSTLRPDGIEDVAGAREIVARDQCRRICGAGLDGVGQGVVDEHARVPPPDECSWWQAESSLLRTDVVAVPEQREEHLVGGVAAGETAEPGVGKSGIPFAGTRERLGGLRRIVHRIGALDGNAQREHSQLEELPRLADVGHHPPTQSD
ncbi:hypothetical protein GOOTI_192_00200 [Gordonia otitidis NBRC 100426]|uniref:Uncharacterized protein n=1 Tax=Gordonia otitidis (strain DSM 44809 / CCUG 52243 / JCM 12355 / NBRC 100426 / IFM 10032) TaxID=1108044 RepID=H5TRC4_GORO1|nr:hypothetical protein GOOTI_192_00200 [Gordonia otitidis NBRC 100426]